MNLAEQDWQFQFSQAYWLWLPILLLVLFLLVKWLASDRVQWQMPDALMSLNRPYYHPAFDLIRTLTENKIAAELGYFKWLRLILVWVFITLCCVAMARPEWIRKQWQQPDQFRDIVFVVDTSVSMMQRDYLLDGKRIDRMSLLKGVLSRFVTQLQGDNVSIVVYADAVYTLVPLTRDHELAKTMLARINTGLAGRTSALGNALAQAVHETQQSGNQQRVLVLFTDATRLTGEINVDVATEMARQAGLRIYTVAIGARTYEASEKKIAGLIYDPANIQRLESIAKHTGGKFYWAGDTRTLSGAIKDIEQAESRKDKPQVLTIRQPLYQWPLLLALGIFTLMQYMNLRQKAQL